MADRTAARIAVIADTSLQRHVLQQALSGQGAGAGYPMRAVLQALHAPLQVYLAQ